MSRRCLAGLASMALGLAAGCSDTHYRVSIRFDPSVLGDQAVAVAVYLAPTCPAAEQIGAPPAQTTRSLVVRRGDPPPSLGTIDEGRYGLHAIARADDCGVVAAGCTPVRLEQGEGGTLSVVLQAASGPGCEAGQTCFGGTCVAGGRDAGTDAAALDAGTDAAPPDAAVDASTPVDAGLDGAVDASVDAAVPTDAGLDAAAPLTCDERYNTANEYVLCDETATECTFHVHPIGNAGCDEVCALRGGVCISAYRDDGSCQPGVDLGCGQHATDEVCVCTRN